MFCKLSNANEPMVGGAGTLITNTDDATVAQSEMIAINEVDPATLHALS